MELWLFIYVLNELGGESGRKWLVRVEGGAGFLERDWEIERER